jgi:hypothetical protein
MFILSDNAALWLCVLLANVGKGCLADSTARYHWRAFNHRRQGLELERSPQGVVPFPT